MDFEGLYLAYNPKKRCYFNPKMKNPNKLDYNAPKLYKNINALMANVKKHNPDVNDWEIHKASIKSENLNLTFDFWEDI